MDAAALPGRSHGHDRHRLDSAGDPLRRARDLAAELAVGGRWRGGVRTPHPRYAPAVDAVWQCAHRPVAAAVARSTIGEPGASTTGGGARGGLRRARSRERREYVTSE